MNKREWSNVQMIRKVENIKRINPDKDTYSDIPPFIYQMEKYERALQKLAEHSCNGYPMPKIEYRDGKIFRYDVEDVAWRARCEKREARIEKQVKALADEFNLTVDFQGDPRGQMFSLKDKDGREVF